MGGASFKKGGLKMNALESCRIANPYSKTDECAKFSIDDPSASFIMHGVASVGHRYTYSMWLKADADGSVVVCGETFQATTAWQKHSVTFVAESEDVTLNFAIAGTYYVYHAQLEVGDRATDWTPAVENVDESILAGDQAVRDEMITQRTSIISDCERIILSALQSYVETGELEEFRSTVSTQLELMAGEISMNFTTATEQITDVNGEMQTKFTELYKYISFSENGITIGGNESEITLTIDNDGIIFSKNGVPFGRWDGNDFYTGNIVVEVNERAQFGSFAFIPRSDGSLSFLKVGG